MSDLPTVKHGDKLKNALKAFSDAVQANPDKSRTSILNTIIIRFDLSPKESDFLNKHFTSEE